MEILARLLIVAVAVVLLKRSSRFRQTNRELDEKVLCALKRIVNIAEEYGYPPQFVPFLILLTSLSFMLSIYFTTAYGR